MPYFNGFDEKKPLQQDKILSIYFGALDLNAVTQATLKRQLLKAGAMAGSWRASNSIILRAIVNIGQALGNQISSARGGWFRYLEAS